VHFDDWSIFPEAGLALSIGDDFAYHQHHGHQHDFDTHDHVHVNVDPVIGFGARWHFGERMGLLMRLVFPYGSQIGITF
jgi:hypothetical protein